MAAYAGSGIQAFTHVAHTPYACLGPYIPSWKKGAAPWHPSVVGHRLRAGMYMYIFGGAAACAVSIYMV